MLTRAGMATHAPRLAYIAPVIQAAAKQVDELYVYLNGFPELPKGLPRAANVYWHCGRNLGASAKLAFAEGADVYFCADDDLIWSPDYVSRSLAALDRKPDALWSWHGITLLDPFVTYRQSRTVIGCTQPKHPADTRVHIPGTGASFWLPRNVSIDLYDGKRPIQHDAIIGARCHDLGVEVWTPRRSRPAGRSTPASRIASIVGQTIADPEPVDSMIRASGLWRVRV